MDDAQAAAVAARIELDLRIGAAFTRWQTLQLQGIAGLENQVISYGSCQFPTLGFVVDRYKRVKNFVPEPFWSIKVIHRRDDINVAFSWDRHRLFDRMIAVILFERCLQARTARVTSVVTKPTKKWYAYTTATTASPSLAFPHAFKTNLLNSCLFSFLFRFLFLFFFLPRKPLPLTTVELQKLGSRFLGLTSKVVMEVHWHLSGCQRRLPPLTGTPRLQKNSTPADT